MTFLQSLKGPILVMVTLALAIGGIYYFSQQGQLKEDGATTAPATGTIEGSLSFPAGGIPTEMAICAENITTKEQYCTGKHLQDTARVGYKIEAPAESYYVFAYLPEGGYGYEADYRAYYSKFVTCGQSVDCTSHKLIVVTVTAGETTSNIDPQDWYIFDSTTGGGNGGGSKTPTTCTPTGCGTLWRCSGTYYIEGVGIYVPGLCFPSGSRPGDIFSSWSGTCRQCP